MSWAHTTPAQILHLFVLAKEPVWKFVSFVAVNELAFVLGTFGRMFPTGDWMNGKLAALLRCLSVYPPKYRALAQCASCAWDFPSSAAFFFCCAGTCLAWLLYGIVALCGNMLKADKSSISAASIRGARLMMVRALRSQAQSSAAKPPAGALAFASWWLTAPPPCPQPQLMWVVFPITEFSYLLDLISPLTHDYLCSFGDCMVRGRGSRRWR